MKNLTCHKEHVLIDWKAVLDIPQNNHHKLTPLIPEVLFDILAFLNEDALNGEISHGMFQAYVRLLRIHSLLTNDCLFYRGSYFYKSTVKGKRALTLYESENMEEASGSSDDMFSSNY